MCIVAHICVLYTLQTQLFCEIHTLYKGLMKVLYVKEVFVLLYESRVMSCFCYTGLMWASIKFTEQI
jgi:hypothetical protein